MEYLNLIDNKIDEALDNNIIYTILIISLIMWCVFVSTSTKSFINLRMDNNYVKLLFILFILYFATKDIRVSLLLIIIFLLELDKLNMDEVKGELIALMVKDTMLEERISKLENKKIPDITYFN
jgi:hypothetical protein